MTFGMWNHEKIWHENLTDHPPRLSDVATVPREIEKKSHRNKVIFNSIIHTYFWLFTLSHKKTICNPLAHPTWKYNHTNLWIVKLFHLTEGLLCSFRRWRLWKEPVVMSGNWNVRQAISQQVFKVTTFCINTWFQSFCDTVHSRSTLRCVEIQPTSQ